MTSPLQHAADLLDQTAAERARVAKDATEQWRGRYREEFDEHLERMLRHAQGLARECRDASNQIAQANQRASGEQKRRERERRTLAHRERSRGKSTVAPAAGIVAAISVLLGRIDSLPLRPGNSSRRDIEIRE